MDDYGARIRKAWRDWHDANDPATLSWAQVQQKCMAILGKPETSVAVLKWKEGQQEPTLAEFRALGQVLGVDPRTLAFGEGPSAAPQSAEDAPGTAQTMESRYGDSAARVGRGKGKDRGEKTG